MPTLPCFSSRISFPFPLHAAIFFSESHRVISGRATTVSIPKRAMYRPGVLSLQSLLHIASNSSQCDHLTSRARLHFERTPWQPTVRVSGQEGATKGVEFLHVDDAAETRARLSAYRDSMFRAF